MSEGKSGSRRVGRGRLSRSAEFERVYRRGRSQSDRYMVLHVFPRGDDSAPRVGLSVSRKVGGAVERNRVKRLLREALGEVEGSLDPGQDLVIVARPDLGGLAAREGLSGVVGSLSDLLARTRGVPATGTR